MTDTTTKYLHNIIDKYEKHELCSVYGAAFEDFQNITVQDTYVSPPFLHMAELPSIVYPATDDLIHKYNHIYSNSGDQNKQNPPIKESPVFSADTNKVFFIPSGCGKTTLAKMYTLQYAYKKLSSVSDLQETTSGKDATLYPEFSFIEDAFPILIHGSDMKPLCLEENVEGLFERLVLASICEVLEDSDETHAKALYDSQDKIVLIIDDFHCIMDNDINPDLSIEHSPILSAFKMFIHRANALTYLFAEYPLNCLIDEFAEDNGFARYTIPSLSTYEGVAFVTRFSEHWYHVIGTARNQVFAPENYLRPFLHNATILAHIRTIKELSLLLTISVYDSFLPSNTTKMIGKLLETKINEALSSDSPFKLQDILVHLSEIAYHMQYHNTNSLSEVELNSIFDDKSELPVSELIKFTINCRLLQQTGNGYCFSFRDEKEYLVALGIKNHLFTSIIKPSRFDYIKEPLTKNNIHWHPTIRHLAVLDEKLRKQIIDMLLQLVDHSKNEEGLPYIGHLRTLITSPDVVILNSDFERFIHLTAGRKSNWSQFSIHKEDWVALFSHLSPKKQSLFISTLVNIYESFADAKERKAYCQVIRKLLLFCLYQYDGSLDKDILQLGCKTFFTENDAETIAFIYFSCSNKARNKYLIELLKETNCDMLAAIIEAFTINDHPIESVLHLLKKSSASAHTTAIHILYGISSVSRHNLWEGYDLMHSPTLYLECDKNPNQITEFITSKLLEPSPAVTATRNILEETYVNFCTIYPSFSLESSTLYDIQLLKSYLIKGIERWKNDGLLTPLGEYWNEFKIIACFFDQIQSVATNSLVTEKEVFLQMLQANNVITRQTTNTETFLLSLQLQMLLLILTNPKYYTHSENLRETLVRYYVQDPLYIKGNHSYITLESIRMRLHNELRNWAATESNHTE